MRVLVCGSRDWTDCFAINCVLNGYLSDGDPFTVISGMAKGADAIAAEWAVLNGQELLAFPAEWDMYGKSAGPVRNRQMLEEGKPDIVWAFKTRVESRGTNHMVNLSRKAGVLTYEVTSRTQDRATVRDAVAVCDEAIAVPQGDK